MRSTIMHRTHLTKSPVQRQLIRSALCLTLAASVWLSASTPALGVVRSADRVAGQRYKDAEIPKAAMPDVAATAGVLVTEDGRELWSRRPSDRVSMASLTKVMTAIVASEKAAPDEIVTIPMESTTVGESTSFLRRGEKLPMSELYEALLVKSGNDAAYAIASHVAGTEDDFAELMNLKAADLGLTDTRFTNSHGLDETGHHSTARDLGVIARYAMTRPEIRAVTGKKKAKIGSGKRAETFQNTNLLIGNYDGANGIKTGWTSKAGYCVIVSAKRGDIELYAVVLGSTSELQRFRDARALLDFGFAHYRPQRMASAGTVIGEAPVADWVDRTAPAAVSQDTTIAVFDLSGPITREVSVATVDAPVEVGQRVGVATFVQNGEVIESVPLVATKPVPKPNVFQSIGVALTRAWRFITGS